jgi:glycyl-tRNA synthetase beta chain
MDRELLLEIGVEELPASWLPGLTSQLASSLTARLTARGYPLKVGVEAHATPRRLSACLSELVDRQEEREETIMGPPVSASFDAEGHPTNAGLGFARKQGADFDALTQVDTPKGKYLAYVKHQRGRATVDVMPEVLAEVLRDLTFARQMHWDAQLEDGRGELLFGRPIRWLLFLYGGRVVPFTISRMSGASSPRVQDVVSGAATYGHRFLATSGRAGRAIKVRSFDEYRKKLAENFVLLSRIERHARIMRDLDSQARRLGGRALLHQHPQAEALLAEVPDLVEFPGVVAGAFSAEFLALPEEVLTTTLIHHQHAFPVVGANGALMPAFLAVTNTEAGSDRRVATNTERVVAARLRDARFFWDADRKIGLEARLTRLATLSFHKKLGSYRDKTARMATLARWIATTVFQKPDQGDAAERAATLAKADLATDMVREFTELQGVMGGIYAREAGEPDAVWRAIYHHYLPVNIEADAAPRPDALGEARVTWAAVSVADKLDTLVGLFSAGERPTGSRDPFALRRTAQGLLRLLLDVERLTGVAARPVLRNLIGQTVAGYAAIAPEAEWRPLLHAFLHDRLSYILEARGGDKRNIRAVLPSHEAGLDRALPDVLENLNALSEFATSTQFRQLATAFKRVRNIARDVPAEPPAALAGLRAGLREPAELALLDEVERRRTAIETAVKGGRAFRAAYAEAAAFEPAIARFFNEVFVMTDDAGLKRARLGMMKQLEQLVLQLGDISEIVAPES